MPIGDKIRTLRKMRGMNQTELGDRLGVKTNAVSKWECGRVEDIPMAKIRAMAALFDVPVSYLMDEEGAKASRAVDEEDIKFALFGGSGEITDAMYREVKEFAALVKLREDMKRSKE